MNPSSEKMSKKIPLTKGQYTIVDDEDYNWLNRMKWYAVSNGKQWGVTRTFNIGGKRKNISMSRYLLNPPKNYIVDHINHNPLDNRKSNLRICTIQQNNWNKRKGENNTTGYKGVSIFRYNKDGTIIYRACIWVNGGNISIGYFHSPKEAYQAYIKAAQHYFGEFACAS